MSKTKIFFSETEEIIEGPNSGLYKIIRFCHRKPDSEMCEHEPYAGPVYKINSFLQLAGQAKSLSELCFATLMDLCSLDINYGDYSVAYIGKTFMITSESHQYYVILHSPDAVPRFLSFLVEHLANENSEFDLDMLTKSMSAVEVDANNFVMLDTTIETGKYINKSEYIIEIFLSNDNHQPFFAM